MIFKMGQQWVFTIVIKYVNFLLVKNESLFNNPKKSESLTKNEYEYNVFYSSKKNIIFSFDKI